MMSYRRLEALYVLNATLLLTHEIDSGYWREWRLFHLPGGDQGFLLVHLLLLPLVLVGLAELARGRRSGLRFSLGLAGAGILALLLHGFFLLRGHPEFRLPVSLLVLAASAVVSLVQVGAVLAFRRGERSAGLSSR